MFKTEKYYACDNKYHFFDISNEINLLNEVISTLTRNAESRSSEIRINRHYYNRSVIIEHIELLTRYIRRDWHYIQNEASTEGLVAVEELVRVRQEINTILSLIIENLINCDSENLKSDYLKRVVKEINTIIAITLPISELNHETLKLSSFENGLSVFYQYYHTFLDLQYLLLIIFQINDKRTELETQITIILDYLITLGSKKYSHKEETSFICECSKHFWCFLYLCSEQALGEESFLLLIAKLTAKQQSKFVLCLLKDIGSLQTVSNILIKPNYTLLENYLKDFVTNAEFHTSIHLVLKSVQPLVADYWKSEARIEVFQILWDYFSKRLNVTKETTQNSMIEVVQTINLASWSTANCTGEFQYFASMLQKHLEVNPQHWVKMKGRIYSQLGPSKVKDLNENGISNVLLLFVSLSRINFDEMVKKFCSFVDNLAKNKKHTCVFRYYSAFVYVLVQEGKNVDLVVPTYVKILNDSANDKKHEPIKTFIADFSEIIQVSQNLQLYQWKLIDNWLPKYMSTCYHSDLLTLLNILIKTIDQINREQAWIEWEPQFKQYIYPSVKSISSALSAPKESGILAGKIVVNSSSLLHEAYFFFNDAAMVAEVSSGFLTIVLDPNSSTMLSPAQEALALQTWLKTCILMKETNEELTSKVIKLDIVPQFLKAGLESCRDPLKAFIECLNHNLDDHVQSLEVNKLVETCFGGADRWIRAYLSQPRSEAIVLRVYACLALAFYNIGALLYDRHKMNSPFARLVPAILLPNDVMLGKTINPWVLSGIKKTWHLYFSATFNLLGEQNDSFIERTLRDLIAKYVPYFAIIESPMLKSLDDGELTDVILDKLSTVFFRKESPELEGNLMKALKIVGEFIQGTTLIGALKSVVDKALGGLFEVMMFKQNCKSVALGIVKTIAVSDFFVQVKDDFEVVLCKITDKFLGLNTNEYFQLMGVIAKIVDLKIVMPKIKQRIQTVEKMRGVGFDQSLRAHFDRLETAIAQLPAKNR